jgi:flagellar P-ring protein precursor FlgI
VEIPGEFTASYYDFLNAVLNLEIEPENMAKVIVDERTGTIVIGSDVRISTVAVSHGNLTVTITNSIEVSQPGAFSEGETVVTQNPEIEVAEDTAKLMVVPEGVTVSDLVKALNAIGVNPRDLISILQAVKAAGALHAALEVI